MKGKKGEWKAAAFLPRISPIHNPQVKTLSVITPQRQEKVGNLVSSWTVKCPDKTHIWGSGGSVEVY